MSGYSRGVWDAKAACTELVCDLSRKEPKRTIEDMARAVDNLNTAWDALTDHLVRQRDARDKTIDHLHNVIAELQKGGTK